MIKLDKINVDAQEWELIAEHFTDHNVIQTGAYGDAKVSSSGWSVERLIFKEDKKLVGAVQALVRPLPVLGRPFAWINRGPLLSSDEDQGEANFLPILHLLYRRYVREKKGYIRMVPNILDSQFQWHDEVLKAGFAATAIKGWASSRINLEPKLVQLRTNLDQKWRNALNKAEKSNISVQMDTNQKLFESFIEQSNNFFQTRNMAAPLSNELLRNWRSNLPEKAKFVAAIAYKGEEPVGSMLLCFYRDTCEYLAGNATPRGRKVNSGQLLVWKGIEFAKKFCCQYFDLGGMDKGLTPPGIYNFKKGLNGTPYRLASEITGAHNKLIGNLLDFGVARSRTDF